MMILTHPGDYVLAIKPDGSMARVRKGIASSIPESWAVPSIQPGFYFDKKYYQYNGLLKDPYRALPRMMSVSDMNAGG